MPCVTHGAPDETCRPQLVPILEPGVSALNTQTPGQTSSGRKCPTNRLCPGFRVFGAMPLGLTSSHTTSGQGMPRMDMPRISGGGGWRPGGSPCLCSSLLDAAVALPSCVPWRHRGWPVMRLNSAGLPQPRPFQWAVRSVPAPSVGPQRPTNRCVTARPCPRPCYNSAQRGAGGTPPPHPPLTQPLLKDGAKFSSGPSANHKFTLRQLVQTKTFLWRLRRL